jgi:hypothetical protein
MKRLKLSGGLPMRKPCQVNAPKRYKSGSIIIKLCGILAWPPLAFLYQASLFYHKG